MGLLWRQDTGGADEVFRLHPKIRRTPQTTLYTCFVQYYNLGLLQPIICYNLYKLYFLHCTRQGQASLNLIICYSKSSWIPNSKTLSALQVRRLARCWQGSGSQISCHGLSIRRWRGVYKAWPQNGKTLNFFHLQDVKGWAEYQYRLTLWVG